MMPCDSDDIESLPIPPPPRAAHSDLIFPKQKATTSLSPQSYDINIPETTKVYVKTFGCSHNISDSEYMSGMLAAYGYDLDCTETTADCIVINSCTVKDPSQAAFMNLVKKADTTNTPVVVAGCVPQGDRKLKGLENTSMLGVQQIDRVVDAVQETLKGNTVRLLSKATLPSLDLPKVRKNPLVEIIPLSTGCLGNCTYCKTKHARGKLGSYAPEAILKRALDVAAEGVMEIWLTSEDTGAYGIDLNTSLSALLYLLTDALPPTVMLRVGMTNPPYILDQIDDIAIIMNKPNVFCFLHVPVQSGCNAVLVGEGGMNREYTVEDFHQVCDGLFSKVPDMTIATDIICGFPNETEENFSETMALMEKYRFGICNISQFYPRPGTPAAKMKRIDTKVVKNRSRRFSTLFNSIAPYTKLMGRTMDAWVGIESDNTGLMTVCHLKNYTKVLIPRDDELVGCKISVTIESVERFHVVAKVVEGSVRRLVAKVAVETKGAGKRARKVAVMTGGVEHGEHRENDEENCDEQNYRVEEKKDEGGGDCCGGGGEGACGGGGCDSSAAEKVEKVAEKNDETSDETSDSESIVRIAVASTGLVGAALILYAAIKFFKRKR